MPILEVADTVGRISLAGRMFRPGRYDLDTAVEPREVPEIIRAVERLIYPHAKVYDTDTDGKPIIVLPENYEDEPDDPEPEEEPKPLPGEVEGDEKIGPAATDADVEEHEPPEEVDLKPEEPLPPALRNEDLEKQEELHPCDELGCPQQVGGFRSEEALAAHKAAIHQEDAEE